MNEVQINKIKKRADEYATSCFPYEKQFLEREAVVKCCVHVVTETIAELEKDKQYLSDSLDKQIEATLKLDKENAELRKEWQEQVQKATDEGYARTLQTIQLTKAKELLKRWVELSKPKLEGYPIPPIQEQTEQFLSEVEK